MPAALFSPQPADLLSVYHVSLSGMHFHFRRFALQSTPSFLEAFSPLSYLIVKKYSCVRINIHVSVLLISKNKQTNKNQMRVILTEMYFKTF